MGILKTLGTGQGYLKAGLLGFPKSGKTYTAIEIALGLYKFFGNIGRIAFYDSEGGSEYVAHRVKKATGKELIGVKSRSFKDLMEVADELVRDDLLIVDSITHPWRELCDSHLSRINDKLAQKGKQKRYKLEFQDWNPIKATWDKWTVFYLNSPVHIIICGRAGWEYEMEMNEETGKKELTKTGTKMKTESEFGFEPSLLIEMFRDDTPEGKKQNTRVAVVRGDRFAVIDGKEFRNPTFKDFLPHIQMLKPGANSPIDAELKSDTGVDEEGDADWQREKRERVILCEEIQGEIVKAYPGQSADEKRKKALIIEQCFGTKSWTKVESMRSESLREGLKCVRSVLGTSEAEAVAATGEP